MGVGAVAITVAGGAALATLSYGCFAPRSRMYSRLICRGAQDDPPRVALTFDDGPTPEATSAILDVLAAHDVPAAFFVIGQRAERHAELVRRMYREGHMIGNHTFDHRWSGMFRFDFYWRRELDAAAQSVYQIVGKTPRLFRPPMGFKQPCIGRQLRKRGDQMVTWTRRGLDGIPTSSEQILTRLVEPCQPGDILVLHDGSHQQLRPDPRPTIEALTPLITGLRERGFEFERLDRLIGEPAYADAE